jgi:ornithine cyclodeaminase
MRYLVLTDSDVRRHIDASVAVPKMEDALRELAAGTLVAPPRFSLDTPKGSLVFTAGAATGSERSLGFRVYDTFPGTSTDTSQLVVVFDSESGGLRGIVIGGLIGALRTGALGGVAIKYLARSNAAVLALIGAGLQARAQLHASMAVRAFRKVYVSSRTEASALSLRDEIKTRYAVECIAPCAPKEALADADVAICATDSASPVIEATWVRAGTHVTTVGPKFRGAHELPPELGQRANLVTTDSLAQLRAYGSFFIPDGVRIVGLEEVVLGRVIARQSADDVTLYCSVGLAGTEVVLASELLRSGRRWVGTSSRAIDRFAEREPVRRRLPCVVLHRSSTARVGESPIFSFAIRPSPRCVARGSLRRAFRFTIASPTSQSAAHTGPASGTGDSPPFSKSCGVFRAIATPRLGIASKTLTSLSTASCPAMSLLRSTRRTESSLPKCAKQREGAHRKNHPRVGSRLPRPRA